MNDERRDEIRGMLANATPGPWRTSNRRGASPRIWWVETDDNEYDLIAEVFDGKQSLSETDKSNADLIAAGPTIIADLLAEVERLREELDEIKGGRP